jgi:hypothetical protein
MKSFFRRYELYKRVLKNSGDEFRGQHIIQVLNGEVEFWGYHTSLGIREKEGRDK